MVLRSEAALRFRGRRGLRVRRRLHGGLGLRLLAVLWLLLHGLSRLALLPPATAAPPRAAAGLFRRRQVVGERVRTLVKRPEPLPRGIDQLVCARRVALGRCEECGTDLERLLERGVDQLRGILFVP